MAGNNRSYTTLKKSGSVMQICLGGGGRSKGYEAYFAGRLLIVRVK